MIEAKTISEALSAYGDFSITEEGKKICAKGVLNAGAKGMDAQIECTERSIKIKGKREYEYHINAAATDTFVGQAQEKYPDCTCYVNEQTLAFSKFASYQDPEEAVSIISSVLSAMADTVVQFEKDCVDFHDSATTEETTYDPEADVSIKNVDNSYHAAPVTEQDNENYLERNRTFALETLDKLSKTIGGRRSGNEVTAEDKESGRTIRAIFFPLDAEIMITVSTAVAKEVGAMYSSFLRANYPEYLCSYDDNSGVFSLKAYSSPDIYEPDATEETMKNCMAAFDACVREYSQMLDKRDAAGFASDIQEVLSEQTNSIMKRERSVSEREEDMAAREQALAERTAELEEWAKQLEEKMSVREQEMEEERARLKEHEASMAEEMKAYEERNTKDILKIEQLARQVSALQNRQAALGQGDTNAEDEIFRLKSKVQQLISQKASLEKALTEKITVKDGKIRDLMDTINGKDAEIRKLETGVEDLAKARAAEESEKSAKELEDLRKRLDAIGHIITAGDLVKHFRQYEDMEVRKFHAPDGEHFVVYNDESLEVRIRVGSLNYIDVSKKAALKDNVLKKLNSGNTDIKFFNKGDRIVARTYFSMTASPDDVERLADELTGFFTK